MAYTRQGGSRVFTELLKNADLVSPFEESCLRGVCETAKDWLCLLYTSQHRAECHQPALPQDDRQVMAGHTLVHQGGHQHGDDHLKDTFNKECHSISAANAQIVSYTS